MGESLLVASMYMSYVVTVNDKDSMVDLIVLDLVDFNIILGID